MKERCFMKWTIAILLGAGLMFQGCIFKIDDDYDYDKGCNEPVYLSYKDLRQKPRILSPQRVKKAGKIYIYKDTLFINEPNVGVHVIDNSDPSHPKNLAFIDLPGNIDIAVKDGYLYADSFTDLVVLDVRDTKHIVKVHRQEEVFAYDPYQVGVKEGVYPCYADRKKGVVIGYKE